MENPRVTSFVIHINDKKVRFGQALGWGDKPRLLRQMGNGVKLTKDEEREARRLAQLTIDAARQAAHQYMLERATDEQPLLFPASSTAF